jgi:hypothetical protein
MTTLLQRVVDLECRREIGGLDTRSLLEHAQLDSGRLVTRLPLFADRADCPSAADEQLNVVTVAGEGDGE